MIQALSHCCNQEIVKRTKREFPVGGFFGQTIPIDVCRGCCRETETVLVDHCDCCGEANEHLVVTPLGDWCNSCCVAHAEDLIVREVSA
jgi:hypothetical protein